MTGTTLNPMPERKTQLPGTSRVDTRRAQSADSPAALVGPEREKWISALGLALVVLSLAVSAWLIMDATSKTPSPILSLITG